VGDALEEVVESMMSDTEFMINGFRLGAADAYTFKRWKDARNI
jgi:hypothetical protein